METSERIMLGQAINIVANKLALRDIIEYPEKFATNVKGVFNAIMEAEKQCKK